MEAYAKAFNAHDAKEIASFWAKEAEYVTPQTGETAKGRDEIAKLFEQTFEKKKDLNLDITLDKVIFPSSDTAVASGVAIVKSADKEAHRSAFKAYYQKQGHQWLLTQVREVDYDFAPSNYEHLKELDWLIGDWMDEDEDSSVNTSYSWDKYKNFLTQQFSVQVEGRDDIEGRQIIAWDPVENKIRSWLFDSDGTFGEGTWKKEDNKWVVEMAQTLSDGQKASAINVYTQTSPNSYTWESTGREVGGVMLPDIPAVENKRIKE